MSIRFAVGLIHLAFVCFIGLRTLRVLPASAIIIVGLVWFSFGCDLYCFALYSDGKDFVPIEHLYAMFEFLAEMAFIYLTTENTTIRRVAYALIPLFFFSWIGTQYIPGVLTMRNEPMVVVADATANALIIWLTVIHAMNVSDAMHIYSPQNTPQSLFTETFRQLWLSENGKIFIGLLIYNFFGLCIYLVELLYPSINLIYFHSFSHIAKHTCFVLSFLQTHRRHASSTIL